MKKYIIVLLFLMLIFPTATKAQERLEVNCTKVELKTNEETECKIIAKDLDFVITGISAKIKVSKNINIVNSEYNNEKWMMLDEEFNVEEINLINEQPIKEDNVEIASFKIKSNTSSKVKEEILLENILIGDQNYEKREIKVQNEILYINKKYNSSKNYIVYVILVLLGAFMAFCVIRGKKKGNRGAV